MSLERISDPEAGLLNMLGDISPIAWRKYQRRYSRIWMDGEYRMGAESGKPPYICFRFEVEQAWVIEKLALAIASHSGEIKWCLDSHKREGLGGVNWILQPERSINAEIEASKINFSVSEYFAKFEPGFCAKAFGDLVALESHVRSVFGLGQ
jgi:hypothetical protein